MKNFDNFVFMLFVGLAGVALGMAVNNSQLGDCQDSKQQLLLGKDAMNHLIEALKKQNRELEFTLQKANQQNHDLTARSDMLQDSVQGLLSRNKQLKNDTSRLHLENQALTDSIAVLNQACSNAENRAEAAELECETLRKKRTKLRFLFAGNSLFYALLIIGIFNLLPRSIRKFFDPPDPFV